MRKGGLIAQAVLAAAVAALVFPASGSALNAVLVALTASGPSQTVLTLPAGLYPVWENQDTVPHTIAFANGLCSFQVAPGGYGLCNGFSSYVGDYAYTIDGTVQAQVVVKALSRSVTLGAKSRTVLRHSLLRLHGRLEAPVSGPPNPGASGPVILLARHDRFHPFRRVATVRARVRGRWGPDSRVLWQLRVRPRARTIYIAEAKFQPAGGQVWQPAWSRPFKVLVRGTRR
jgi:hypothetical protein